jgi:hypothetical protein
MNTLHNRRTRRNGNLCSLPQTGWAALQPLRSRPRVIKINHPAQRCTSGSYLLNWIAVSDAVADDLEAMEAAYAG